jgi:type I restriction enzyme, S subunit
MTAGLRPYPEYKESGLPWLGQVPAHWSVKPALACYSPKLCRNTGLKESTVLSLSYGQIIVKPPEKLHGLVPESFETYQIIDPGDIIIRATDLQNDHTSLRVAIARNRGIITSAYLCLKAKEGLSSAYGYRFLSAWDLTKSIYGFGSGLRQNLDFSHFKRMPVLVPSSHEQLAIEDYLRSITIQVRRFIHNRRRMIAVLNEQKQAIINRAVTRGLDPLFPLKPSGIDWLGDIPENWQVCRLRNVVSQVTSGSRGWSSYAADEGPLFLRIANLRRMSLQLRFDNVIRLNLPETSEAQRTQVQGGDILVSITAYIGSIAVVPSDLEEAYVSQHVALCRPRDDKHNPRWLGYALLSEVGQIHGQLSLYGGTKDGLSLDDVKNYPVLLPPRDEQDKLVERIELQLESTETAIDRAQSEIDLIREYRTRLIADVVTGKVDVRHLAPLLEAVEVEVEPEDLDEGLEDEMPGEDDVELAEEVADADD